MIAMEVSGDVEIPSRLFTCNMSRPMSRERGAPVPQVSLYGDDGRRA
jgi:hypothetical protein